MYEAMQRMKKSLHLQALLNSGMGGLRSSWPTLAERSEGSMLQQVFDEAYFVVLEYYAVAFLGGVEVDVGSDGKVVVAFGVAEGLLYVPYVLRLFV